VLVSRDRRKFWRHWKMCRRCPWKDHDMSPEIVKFFLLTCIQRKLRKSFSGLCCNTVTQLCYKIWIASFVLLRSAFNFIIHVPLSLPFRRIPLWYKMLYFFSPEIKKIICTQNIYSIKFYKRMIINYIKLTWALLLINSMYYVNTVQRLNYY